MELIVSKKGLCAGFFKALNLKTNKMFFFSQVTKFSKSFHKWGRNFFVAGDKSVNILEEEKNLFSHFSKLQEFSILQF